MKNKHFLAILSTTSFLSACSSSIDYGSAFQPETDFSGLTSYSWYVPDGSDAFSNNYMAEEIADTSIRESIKGQLQGKNFAFVSNPEEADFLVNYAVITDDTMNIRSYRSTHGYAVGWGFAGDYHVATGYGGYPYRETQNTFVLDIVSAANKLIWQGKAEGKIESEELTLKEQNAFFAEAVVNLLADFPVKKASRPAGT